MNSHLTYRPREGIVFGTVANKAIQLVTLRSQGDTDIELWRQVALAAGASPSQGTVWEHGHEFRAGKWKTSGAIQHKLTVAENAPLETYDYPGEFAQRFDGVGPPGSANHPHHRRIVWVKFALKTSFPGGGLCLHGPPPCGSRPCIVIVQDWDSLFQALKTENKMSVDVEL